MSDSDIRVIPDTEVIRYIHQEPGRFAAFIGAGASREADVPTASEISNDILGRLTAADPDTDVEDLKRELKWNKPTRRYSTSLLRYGNDAQRVEYFRKLLRGKRPAFSHHATALLMRNGVLKGTCITTNFDKLLEVAFAQQNDECQPIRMRDEARFWRAGEPDRYYAVKLHGDYDTYNILNTADETLRIEPDLAGIVRNLLSDGGLLVLGAGGFEQSVVGLFNELVAPTAPDYADAAASSRVPLGVYWGIYLGTTRPERISDAEVRAAVEKAINSGSVSEEVVEMMARGNTKSRPCAFFPIWGAGSFLFRVVQRSADKALIGRAELYLDHEMRLRHVFSKAGLSPDAIDRHLRKLWEQRSRIDMKAPRPAPEVVCVAKRAASQTEIRVLYGDITSRTLMASEPGRRAVLSAEDTSVSAGGGVAYALLLKAGAHTILNELSKLAPIAQGDVAVTSGGDLPIHYIFHGAALKIERDATYSVTPGDVSRTVTCALQTAQTLAVKTILVPLIAAGVGPLTPLESFEAIVCALLQQRDTIGRFTMIVVVFKESQLPRADIMASLQRTLPDFELTVPGGVV
jgi:O-acetyl-ADP-ribose deacetylase (regulator of RNase III)